MKFYITFGQVHAHSIDGRTYDKDSVLVVEAESEIAARIGLNLLTNGKWCGLYREEHLAEMMHYYPRGILNADKPLRIEVAAKCDGNHGGPRCADLNCWNDESR